MSKNFLKKLDREKVYKIFVILLTVFFIWKWTNDTNIFSNGAVIEKEYDKCDLLYMDDKARHNVCYAAAQREFLELPKRINQDLQLVITMPLVFFGGAWLYKHFSILKSKNREKDS